MSFTQLLTALKSLLIIFNTIGVLDSRSNRADHPIRHFSLEPADTKDMELMSFVPMEERTLNTSLHQH